MKLPGKINEGKRQVDRQFPWGKRQHPVSRKHLASEMSDAAGESLLKTVADQMGNRAFFRFT